MPYDDEMFKVYPGSHHPFDDDDKSVNEDDIGVARRYGERWSDEEILTVMFAQPPTTYDEIAAHLQREPGAIHAIKSFIRKAILHPDQYRQPDGTILSRHGIVKRIYRLLDEHGVRDWPRQDQEAIAAILPGTQTTHARRAKFLARNT